MLASGHHRMDGLYYLNFWLLDNCRISLEKRYLRCYVLIPIVLCCQEISSSRALRDPLPGTDKLTPPYPSHLHVLKDLSPCLRRETIQVTTDKARSHLLTFTDLSPCLWEETTRVSTTTRTCTRSPLFCYRGPCCRHLPPSQPLLAENW